MKCKIIYAFFAMTIFSYSSKAMDNTFEKKCQKLKFKEGEKSETLPSEYKHISPLKQIEHYQHLYDCALEQKKNIREDPIDGLDDVLKNGFALVHDCIKGDYHIPLTKNVNYDVLKGKYIEELKRLFEITEKMIEKNKGLSAEEFQRLSASLSILISAYKIGLALEDSLKKKFFEDYLSYNQHLNVEEKTFPFFVVYLKPEQVDTRMLSPERFVDAFCHNPDQYHGYIVTFDVLEKQKQPNDIKTKKDPHWSLVTGTYDMFYHDVEHIRSQDNLLSLYPKFKEATNKLCKTRAKLNKDSDDYTIFTYGLFMITHELPNITSQFYGDDMYAYGNISLVKDSKLMKKLISVEEIVDFTKVFMIDFLGNLTKDDFDEKNTPYNIEALINSTKSPIGAYKTFGRDWEFILQKNKEMKDLKDDKGESIYPHNSEREILKETLKGQDQKPITDLKKYYTLKENDLKEAYKKFWDCFLKIYDKNK